LKKNSVTSTAVLELHAALSDWLKNHIMKVDTSLRSCIKT
jgi:hypothetical protein